MSKSPPRLGKGLSALITPRTPTSFHHRPDALTAESMAATQAGQTVVRQVPVDRIQPNPHQPRASLDEPSLRELANSIRRIGVLQPILLRPLADGDFQLVAGERRWRAAQLAQLQTVPALVRDFSDAESFETALVENLQREDLGPLERAAAYQQLIDTLGLTADDVATHLGESRANVANYLRLLKLEVAVQRLISKAALGMGQARAIAGITNPQRQLALARLAVRRNLSVRQVEALVKGVADPAPSARQPARPTDAHLSEVEQAISKVLGLSVRLYPGRSKNSGRLIIRYNSLEEFDRIADRIGVKPLLE